MCGGGGSQTVTQKQEIDPVLRAHLYGGTLPEGAMTGIIPAYFQPGGTLAGQAGNVRRLYGASLFSPVEDSSAGRSPGDVMTGGGGGDGPDSNWSSDRSGGEPLDATGGRAWGGGGDRGTSSGDFDRSEPGMGGIYREGGIVSLYQEGGAVSGLAALGRKLSQEELARASTREFNRTQGFGPSEPYADTFDVGSRAPQTRAANQALGPSPSSSGFNVFGNRPNVDSEQPYMSIDGEPVLNTRFREMPEGEYNPLSLAEQVYQLSVGTDLGAMLPEYEVAGRTALQRQAEEMAAGGVGAYEPYLSSAGATTGRGIGATGRGIGLTEEVAGAVPGIVQPGQEALRGGAEGVLGAAATGQEAAQRGAAGTLAAAATGQEAATAAAARATGAARRGEQAAGRAAEQTYRYAEEAMPFREEGLAAIREGRAMLGGAAQLYDPMSYRGYMDPFTEEVIRQSERDIARMGDIERQRIGAGAVQAGAFGGSRQAVAEQELARNLADQQARTAAQLRTQGYQTAQQQAQNAFEQQQQRQLTTGQSFGQLGTQTGALGTSFGQLGVGAAGQAGQLGLGAGQLGVQGAQTSGQLGLQGAQMGMAGAGQAAGLGLQGAQMGMAGAETAGQMGAQASQLGLQGAQMGLGAGAQLGALGQGLGTLGGQMAGLGGQAQQMGLQDINTLLTVGGQQQGQTQAELDAARMSQFQRVMAPYQQTAFRADVLSGSPTGIVSTFTQPGPSTASQIAGLGLGAYGLSRSGIFG